MLFGFALAAIAGFLLTAIPNWTGRLPVRGLPLASLAGLWLLGRMAGLVSALMPVWLAVAADLAFPVALAGVIAREIVAGRNWRNLPMVAPVTVLAIADLLMQLEAAGIAARILSDNHLTPMAALSGAPPLALARLGVGAAPAARYHNSSPVYSCRAL